MAPARALAVVALATFFVRLVFPFGTDTFGDLNLWQWPSCIALFALGIATSRRGWLSAVPDPLRRRSRDAALAGMIAVVTLVLFGGSFGIAQDDLGGGWSVPALAIAIIESTLAVFGAVWMLATAQRHLSRPLPMGHVLSSVAYLAFIVQGFILIGLAVALRPISAIAEVKALLVAVLGIAGSFGLAWLLLRSVRRLARVL